MSETLPARPIDLAELGARAVALARNSRSTATENAYRSPTIGLPAVRPSRHCGRPCSGARRRWNRRTPPTRSTAPPSTASSSISAGVEIDRDTGSVRVDKYVRLHDAGGILNP